MFLRFWRFFKDREEKTNVKAVYIEHRNEFMLYDVEKPSTVIAYFDFDDMETVKRDVKKMFERARLIIEI